MNSLWSPLALDAKPVWTVIRHPSASPRAVMKQTATDGVDITQFVTSMSQQDAQWTIKLSWHMELYVSGAQPKCDEVMEIKLNGQQLYIGIVQNVQDYGESRGQRSMSIVTRSRDNTPLWRNTQSMTAAYAMTTDLMTIVNDIIQTGDMNLDESIAPASIGSYTVHTNTQMAEMTLWDMLTTLLNPSGYDPYIDSLGRFKIISRGVGDAPIRTITADRLKSVVGSKAKPAVTRVRVKWLDPNLSKSAGQDQSLGSVSLTAGFFQDKIKADVWFSSDHSQRAENTRLVIKQSCNSGLLPVATEKYSQIDEMHGTVELDTEAYIPILAGASLAAMMALDASPDLVVVAGFGASSGTTIPVGRILHGVAEGVLLVTMMSIGTGTYEIWGTPFDYVYNTNTTEAFDNTAPTWSDNVVEISNDFVMNDAQAQAYATRELVYQALAAATHTIEIIEDPSLEWGDIVELPDGSRFKVTGIQRSIQKGQAHTMQLSGFRV